jgi:hypothetical protein
LEKTGLDYLQTRMDDLFVVFAADTG